MRRLKLVDRLHADVRPSGQVPIEYPYTGPESTSEPVSDFELPGLASDRAVARVGRYELAAESVAISAAVRRA